MTVERELLGTALLLLAGGLGGSMAKAADAEDLRINQIQVIGTHNSYHAGLTPEVAKLIKQKDPSAFEGLDYAHSDLAVQFDHGVRQVELDIYADEKGGRFAHPFGANVSPGGAAAFDKAGVMSKPGFKVMHLQDLDYISNCQPFIACLQTVRTWSNAHPSHIPIFILVETKTQAPLPGVPMVAPEPFTAPVLDALDQEIRSVFSTEEMVLPDQVRGLHQTLEEAVRLDGWPRLSTARGKVVFLLDQKNVTDTYAAGHPALRGRVLFTNSDPGHPDAAFVEENDGTPEVISALVKQGYLVRTRADADTKEARSGDVSRRDQALASGAQIISTDYPWFEPSPWTSYSVSLPGKAPARCDPVNAPSSCRNVHVSEAAGPAAGK